MSRHTKTKKKTRPAAAKAKRAAKKSAGSLQVTAKTAAEFSRLYSLFKRTQGEFDRTVSNVAAALEIPEDWVLVPRQTDGGGTAWEFVSQEEMAERAAAVEGVREKAEAAKEAASA